MNIGNSSSQNLNEDKILFINISESLLSAGSDQHHNVIALYDIHVWRNKNQSQRDKFNGNFPKTWVKPNCILFDWTGSLIDWQALSLLGVFYIYKTFEGFN